MSIHYLRATTIHHCWLLLVVLLVWRYSTNWYLPTRTIYPMGTVKINGIFVTTIARAVSTRAAFPRHNIGSSISLLLLTDIFDYDVRKERRLAKPQRTLKVRTRSDKCIRQWETTIGVWYSRSLTNGDNHLEADLWTEVSCLTWAKRKRELRACDKQVGRKMVRA